MQARSVSCRKYAPRYFSHRGEVTICALNCGYRLKVLKPRSQRIDIPCRLEMGRLDWNNGGSGKTTTGRSAIAHRAVAGRSARQWGWIGIMVVLGRQLPAAPRTLLGARSRPGGIRTIRRVHGSRNLFLHLLGQGRRTGAARSDNGSAHEGIAPPCCEYPQSSCGDYEAAQSRV